MAYNALTDNATGAVLRYGYSEFTGDPDYDAGTMTQVALNDGAQPVTDLPLYYQKIVAGNFVEMSAAEKSAVQDAGLAPEDKTTGMIIGTDSLFKVGTDNYDAWYSSPSTGANLTTGAIAANTLYAMPLILPIALRIDRIAINVTTAGTGSARLGIYKDKLGYPKKLKYDAGEVDISTTGAKKITGNQKLDPGFYWMVVVSNGTPTIRCFTKDGLQNLLGWSSTLPNNPNYGLSVAFTYAALPDQFPASPSFINAVPIPTIWVRADKLI
jgi:hypothetical protein